MASASALLSAGVSGGDFDVVAGRVPGRERSKLFLDSGSWLFLLSLAMSSLAQPTNLCTKRTVSSWRCRARAEIKGRG